MDDNSLSPLAQGLRSAAMMMSPDYAAQQSRQSDILLQNKLTAQNQQQLNLQKQKEQQAKYIADSLASGAIPEEQRPQAIKYLQDAGFIPDGVNLGMDDQAKYKQAETQKLLDSLGREKQLGTDLETFKQQNPNPTTEQLRQFQFQHLTPATMGNFSAKDAAGSPLAKLLAERNALPPNDPNRAAYDNAIRKSSETSGQITPRINVNVGGGTANPDTVDFYAKRILAGDPNVTRELAFGDKSMKRAIADRVAQLGKDGGPGEIIANKAEVAATTKALADRSKYVAAGNQFVRNMNSQMTLVEKYMDKGTAGGIPVFNKWVQSGRLATGDPDVAALDTAIRGLAREHQRIVTGVTSNAQLHVASQATADELLNRAQTPAQIRAVLGVMKEEANNAISSGKAEVVSLRGQLTGKPAVAAKSSGVMSLDDYLKSKGH